MIPLCAGGVPHIFGKISTRATTLFWTSLQSKVCTQSYGPPKLRKFQFRGFRDSNLGVLGQNDIWVLVPWPSTENTIRGKVLASPKSKLWWVLWVRVCLLLTVHQKCSCYALTNLLFGLCRFMWVIDLIVTLPSPYFEALATPFYPWSATNNGTYSNSSFFHCVHLGLTFEPIKELGSASCCHHSHIPFIHLQAITYV
jgi:hypothetical protein